VKLSVKNLRSEKTGALVKKPSVLNYTVSVFLQEKCAQLIASATTATTTTNTKIALNKLWISFKKLPQKNKQNTLDALAKRVNAKRNTVNVLMLECPVVSGANA